MSTYISEPGTRLGGRYRLEDRIAGASGWAAWKAIDEILARGVTVLTFAPGFPRVREVVTAARAASRLTDSRLAQVFDVEDDCDRAYIVLEWAAGDSLDDLLAAGPLEPALGARIVAEAAAALSVAHAAGIAHLCLTPGSIRWTQAGGVKIVGLGIDAALAGASADDPALADTRSLGRLLYAALTGLWPGPDYPALPPAPFADGSPRSPRQVRAGVPAALDDVTCRALQLRPRGSEPGLRSPADLARALAAATPPLPLPLPPATPRPRAEIARQKPGRERGTYPGNGHRAVTGRLQPWDQPAGHGERPRPRRRRSSKAKMAALVLLILAAVVGAVAASRPLWARHAAPAPSHQPSHGASPPPAADTILAPVSAQGLDETSTNADMAIDHSLQTAWTTQWYKGNPVFGGLKTGSGLIVDMGHAVRLSSVDVQFGPVPGADVQIMAGNTGAPQASVSSFTTVASATNVAGSHLFTVHSPVAGRYLLIWFTRLPPLQGQSPGLSPSSVKYEAEIFNIIVRGHA